MESCQLLKEWMGAGMRPLQAMNANTIGIPLKRSVRTITHTPALRVIAPPLRPCPTPPSIAKGCVPS